jgi:hypothetical protein
MAVAISPRERLLRVLRHQKTDRLPICPVGMSPFTWHMDFPAYRPVLEAAGRYCEFMVGFPLDIGLAYCDPKALGMTSSVVENGERKTRTTVLRTTESMTNAHVFAFLAANQSRPQHLGRRT